MQKNIEQNLTKIEIIDTLISVMENMETITLSPQGKPVSFFCLIDDIANDWISIINPIPPIMLPYILTSNMFTIFCRSYALDSSKIKSNGTRIKFPIPDNAQRAQMRTSVRTYYAQHKETAKVEISHPFDKNTILTRRLFDLSDSGMSIRAKNITQFIQPDRLLPSCKIIIPKQQPFERSGKVVYVKQIIDLDGESYYQVGIRFIESEVGE